MKDIIPERVGRWLDQGGNQPEGLSHQEFLAFANNLSEKRSLYETVNHLKNSRTWQEMSPVMRIMILAFLAGGFAAALSGCANLSASDHVDFDSQTDTEIAPTPTPTVSQTPFPSMTPTVIHTIKPSFTNTPTHLSTETPLPSETSTPDTGIIITYENYLKPDGSPTSYSEISEIVKETCNTEFFEKFPRSNSDDNEKSRWTRMFRFLVEKLNYKAIDTEHSFTLSPKPADFLGRRIFNKDGKSCYITWIRENDQPTGISILAYVSDFTDMNNMEITVLEGVGKPPLAQ